MVATLTSDRRADERLCGRVARPPHRAYRLGWLPVGTAVVARVAARVRAGGHGVPEAKIRARWHRLWPLVAHAVDLCESTTIWDNGQLQPRIVATITAGIPDQPASWPSWTPEALRTQAS